MRYFIGILVTVGLFVLVLFLIFSGGSKSPAKAVDLRDYVNSGARAQLIIDGPTVADQNHQEIEIDVTQSLVTMTLYQGYQRTITNTASYANNNNAFDAFLYGLQRSAFTAGDTSKDLADYRGYCVEGVRYVYTFDDADGKNLIHFWSTSCSQGTYKGSVERTLYLFKNQVPDYDKLTSNLSFST